MLAKCEVDAKWNGADRRKCLWPLWGRHTMKNYSDFFHQYVFKIWNIGEGITLDVSNAVCWCNKKNNGNYVYSPEPLFSKKNMRKWFPKEPCSQGERLTQPSRIRSSDLTLCYVLWPGQGWRQQDSILWNPRMPLTALCIINLPQSRPMAPPILLPLLSCATFSKLLDLSELDFSHCCNN